MSDGERDGKLRPLHEMTDGEIRREIEKHRAALESGNATDPESVQVHLDEFQTELETREADRRKPIAAWFAGTGNFNA
jgi:hypothetical protein